MPTVYLSLGSNLGDRARNLQGAIELLEEKGIIVTKRSSVYETEPWGDQDQPLFLNMAIAIETTLEPEALLAVVKDVEAKLGREQCRRWGPRIIDLDILLYNHIILNEGALVIPHPFLHEREFVLRPLHEIAPHIMHPLMRKSIHELFIQLGRKSALNDGIS